MSAIEDIAAERRRQVEVEGWTLEHDDEHGKGELALAAGAYAIWSAKPAPRPPLAHPLSWPWSFAWWKPEDPRRDLIKAGALIVAEIERLDRAAAVRA